MRSIEDALGRVRNVVTSAKALNDLQRLLAETLDDRRCAAITEAIDDLVSARLTELVQDAMVRLGFATSAPDALRAYQTMEEALEQGRQDLRVLANVLDRVAVKMSAEEKAALARASCEKG